MHSSNGAGLRIDYAVGAFHELDSPAVVCCLYNSAPRITLFLSGHPGFAIRDNRMSRMN